MANDRDDDLEREIEAHLQLEAEERMADGAPEQDAREAARREFGSIAPASVPLTAWHITHAEPRNTFCPRFATESVGPAAGIRCPASHRS